MFISPTGDGSQMEIVSEWLNYDAVDEIEYENDGT